MEHPAVASEGAAAPVIGHRDLPRDGDGEGGEVRVRPGPGARARGVHHDAAEGRVDVEVREDVLRGEVDGVDDAHSAVRG